jgi:uncharacterized membrane protein YtjA (UPF0391 family)
MLLFWSLVFLLVALVAAVFSFGGIATSAAWIAKILFFVFLAMAIVGFLANLFRPTRTLL